MIVLALVAAALLIDGPELEPQDRGNDAERPSEASDLVDGGSGGDRVVYRTATRPVTVDLALGTVSGSGDDVLISVENATGSPYADTLTGSAGRNDLRGVGCADTISGGDGADWILPGQGNDIVDGGLKGDGISYADVTVGGIMLNLALAGA